MKQKTQKHNHDAPEKLDLFRDTFRGKMPLTDDYVFHAVFGRDTAESKGALMEILNIILARKQDPIRAIVIKNPIETPEREMEKGTVMDIKAETDAGELLNIGRRVPRAKALHSWHETCLASAECSALSIGGLGAGGLRLQNAARKNSA